MTLTAVPILLKIREGRSLFEPLESKHQFSVAQCELRPSGEWTEPPADTQ